MAILQMLGVAAKQGGVTFQPAKVELAGGTGPLEFALHDFAGQPPPAVLQLPFEKQYDAAWVRARLPRLFGFTPVFVEEEESALLDVGFVAVPDGQSERTVFVCADQHGRAGLHFGLTQSSTLDKHGLAKAFWSLLLAKPDDLADFEQMVYHEPSAVWLKLGCFHGKLFCEASED